MADLQRHDAETPLVVTRGEELYVHHDDGYRYPEGVSGLWSVTLGFHNEFLAAVAYRQMCHYWRFGRSSETRSSSPSAWRTSWSRWS
jgi:adenosylmethionine-8-amino-7-oxononanoate aminotransferase